MMSVSASRRRAFQVVGVLLLLVGLGLFVMAPVTMFSASLQGPDGFQRAAAFGFGGVFLLGLGGFLAQLGFLRPLSEFAASETAGAVEHSAGAVGRGLAGAGLGAAPLVRVRCQGCGFLESEDARFCSSCGATV